MKYSVQNLFCIRFFKPGYLEFFICFMVLLFACSKRVCRYSGDCRSDQTCGRGGVCISHCTINQNCQDGFICLDGMCIEDQKISQDGQKKKPSEIPSHRDDSNFSVDTSSLSDDGISSFQDDGSKVSNDDTYYHYDDEREDADSFVTENENDIISTREDDHFQVDDHITTQTDDDIVPSDDNAQPSVVIKIIITEIMYDPVKVSDSNGEYIELYNIGTATVNLQGWILTDDISQMNYYISPNNPLWFFPNTFMVIGKIDDPFLNGGINNVQSFLSFSLNNAGDSIYLYDNKKILITDIQYDDISPWPSHKAGTAIELKTRNSDPKSPSSWQLSPLPFGSGDFGTPGKDNSLW